MASFRLDLASNDPKSLSLDSPAVGVRADDVVLWVWAVECPFAVGKRTHSCDSSTLQCGTELGALGALTPIVCGAGWRTAGARVG